jgi:hypothetical protein
MQCSAILGSSWRNIRTTLSGRQVFPKRSQSIPICTEGVPGWINPETLEMCGKIWIPILAMIPELLESAPTRSKMTVRASPINRHATPCIKKMNFYALQSIQIALKKQTWASDWDPASTPSKSICLHLLFCSNRMKYSLRRTPSY